MVGLKSKHCNDCILHPFSFPTHPPFCFHSHPVPLKPAVTLHPSQSWNSRHTAQQLIRRFISVVWIPHNYTDPLLAWLSWRERWCTKKCVLLHWWLTVRCIHWGDLHATSRNKKWPLMEIREFQEQCLRSCVPCRTLHFDMGRVAPDHAVPLFNRKWLKNGTLHCHIRLCMNTCILNRRKKIK